MMDDETAPIAPIPPQHKPQIPPHHNPPNHNPQRTHRTVNVSAALGAVFIASSTRAKNAVASASR